MEEQDLQRNLKSGIEQGMALDEIAVVFKLGIELIRAWYSEWNGAKAGEVYSWVRIKIMH